MYIRYTSTITTKIETTECGQLMKKLFTAMLVTLLVLSPIGSYVFQDQTTTVDAKRYKSGKKGFQMNPNRSNNPSQFQKKQNQKPKSNQTAKQNRKGGLMKGLMFGGLAGLLFGSLLANMGMLGSLFGLLINLGALYLLFVIIRKVVHMFKEQKKRKDADPWSH